MSTHSTWESRPDDPITGAAVMPELGSAAAAGQDTSLLGRFTRWLGNGAGRSARLGRLPFTGLPDGIGDVAPGDPALVLTPDSKSREQLLLALLASSVNHRRVTWLSATALTPSQLGPDIRRAALTEHLHAMAWTADAATHLRRLGASHLVREMRASGMHDDDLLILDGLDPWLAQTPENCALEASVAEAAAGLQRWARLHAGPVLALGPAQFRGQSLLPLLADGPIPHLAHFAATGADAALDVLRWGGAAGTALAGRSGRFALGILPDGRWQCRGRAALDAAAALAAPDIDTVHTTREATRDATSLPLGWRVHAGIDALLAATRDAVAATVVLAYDHADALVTLAEVVARLRREHPRLLKIVVRETDASLRRNGEVVLLRLGANSIVERGLGFSHVAQRARELRGAAFARLPQADAAKTLRHLAPDALQGYLPPGEFCTAVERMLDRTAGAALEHSLIQMPLLPHIAHLDALLACSPRRDGDLITADKHGVSLFLFGCAGDEVMAAIDSLFTVPCSELAQHVEIASERPAQQRALAQLRAAAEESPVDYTTVLHSIAPDTARAAVQATVLPMRGDAAARCVQAHVLPLREATV
jgi:cellulose biosynthesis protein BcsE